MVTSFSREEDEAGILAFRLTGSYILPAILKSAVTLDLFNIVAKNTGHCVEAYVSAAEVTKSLPTKAEGAALLVEKMLYLLACNEVVQAKVVDGERAYRLSPAANFYANDATGCSLAWYYYLTDRADYGDLCTKVTNLVLHGSTKAPGATEMKFTDEVPIYNEHFNKAMSYHTKIVMGKLLDVYKGFGELDSLTDVGGGIGTSLYMITSKYPQIKGVNFDLPHVIKAAKPLDGIEHVGGDMFVNIPKSKTIMLKHITHNWDDDCVVKMLTSCYNALPEDGKVILLEYLLPFEPDTTNCTKHAIDLYVIMAVYWGGKERTKNEFETLSRKAGFSRASFQYCAYTCWVIELYK